MTLLHALAAMLFLPAVAITVFLVKEQKEQKRLNQMARNIETRRLEQQKETHEFY